MISDQLNLLIQVLSPGRSFWDKKEGKRENFFTNRGFLMGGDIHRICGKLSTMAKCILILGNLMYLLIIE